MLYDLSYLFLIFLIFSMAGWLIESIYCYSIAKKWVNRGFLIGPYCPIFGFGAIIMLGVSFNYKNDPINLYLMFVVYATMLEYITSYVMERLFNARWWNYSNRKFNIDGRISLSMSLSFGLLGLLLVYILGPFITILLSLISNNTIIFIAIITFIIMMTDLLITLITVFKLKKEFVLIKEDITETIVKKRKSIINKDRLVKAFPYLNIGK